MSFRKAQSGREMVLPMRRAGNFSRLLDRHPGNSISERLHVRNRKAASRSCTSWPAAAKPTVLLGAKRCACSGAPAGAIDARCCAGCTGWPAVNASKVNEPSAGAVMICERRSSFSAPFVAKVAGPRSTCASSVCSCAVSWYAPVKMTWPRASELRSNWSCYPYMTRDRLNAVELRHRGAQPSRHRAFRGQSLRTMLLATSGR